MRPVLRWLSVPVFLWVMAAVALAHSPRFLRDNPGGVKQYETVTDPVRSWAIYGRLASGQSADLIPIQLAAGEPLYVKIIVPARQELRLFRPRAVLLGPGLDGQAPEDLPVEPEPNQGVLLLPEPAEPHQEYEQFTQMNLWEYATLDMPAPESGEFTLVLYDPDGRGGPYTVAIGQKERFGLTDVLTLPLVWVRTRIWLWK